MLNIKKFIEKIKIKYGSLFNSFEKELNKEHEIQMKLAQIIINSTDPEELKNKIIKEVATALNASRCFLLEYDSSKNIFKKITNSYNTSRDSLSNLGYDYEYNVPSLVVKQKYMKSVVVEDTEKFIQENKLERREEAQYYKAFNIKATISVRLEFSEVFLGVLIVHYDVKKPFLKEYDLKVLTDIAEHISIALYLSQLYAEEKSEKEKEILLRSMISIMSSNYDLSDIVNKIFEILGSIYNVQVIYFNLAVSSHEHFYSYASSKSDKIQLLNKDDLSSIYILSYFDSVRNSANYIPDSHNFIIQNNLESSQIEEFFKKNNIKSFILLPISRENIHYGYLIIHFDRTNPITNIDLDFIRTIGRQLAIAIKQVLDYEGQKQTAEREKLTRSVLETIRSTLDLDKIKYEIVHQLGIHLGADRVFFADYDSDTQKYTVHGEYTSSDKINSLKRFDFTLVPGFIENIRTMHLMGKDVIVENIYEYYSNGNDETKELVNFFSKYYFTSFMAINVEYAGDYLGNVVVSYKKEQRFSDEDVNFIKTIAEQSSVAIHQAMLYKKTKINAERERLIGNIVSKTISTFDIYNIKQIVKDIGIITEADRCYFFEAPQDKFTGQLVHYDAEYLASSDIKSIVGYKFLPEDVESFVKMFLDTRDLIVFNYETIEKEQNEEFAGIIKYAKQFDLKSCIGIPFINNNKLVAILAIEYIKKRVLPDDEELSFLRILGNQIRIVFNQIQNYQNTKQLAEREKLLRQIIETVRSTIDLDSVKHEMVIQIGTFLKADRVFFADYFPDKGKYFTSEGNEYRSSDRIRTFVGYDFVATSGFIEAIREIHLSGKDIIFSDLDKYLEENNLKGSLIENFYRETGFIASMAINIYYNEVFYGNLVITFENKREITNEEIEMVRTLADQAGIAIYQSTLYKKEKAVAERETLLREVIETIRSSINIDKTLTTICDKTAEIFKVQRATIMEFFDPNDYTKWIIRREYKEREDIIGLNDIDFDKKVGEYSGTMVLKEGKSLVINNVEKSDTPDYYKATYKKMGVKSILSVPITSENDKFGIILLSSVDNYRDWTKEEVLLLESIASQIYVAIKQANLFKKQRKTAERESLLRRILETVRSSLDLNEVKQKVIQEIGKAFKADRCYFRSYDKTKDIILPCDVEYLASPDLKSLVGIEPNQESLRYLMDEVKRQKKGFYPIVADEEFAKGTPLELYLKENNIKTNYSIPIIDRHDELIWLVLSYSKEDPKLDEDSKRLLETIAYQIDIAFEQIMLYDAVKHNADKEKTLRKIIDASRKSLILNEVLSDICKEITELFKVERVGVAKFRPKKTDQNFFLVEYRTDDNIKSAQDSDDFITMSNYWKDYLLNNSEVKVIENIDKSDLPENVKVGYQNLGIKSIVWIPLGSEDLAWGGLTLSEYNAPREWSEDQINFLKTIADQVYIAIRQAEIYETEKQTAERETTLRKIIKIISSSLDSEEIQKYFIDITGSYFGADRCLFTEYDSETDDFLPFKLEKLKSSDIKSLIGFVPANDFPEFAAKLKKGGTLIIKDLEKTRSRKKYPHYKAFETLYQSGVKSDYALSVKYKDQLMGILILHFIKEKRALNTEEFDFLKILRDQVGTALYQAKLYEKTQIQAEREKMSRSLIEILRSTMDKSTIKHLFVQNIGKFLKADRVFFSDYDAQDKMYLPVEEGAEYLSSPQEKSFVGYNWSDPSTREYIQPLLEKRELNIPSWDEYIQNTQKSQAFISLFEDANVKSSYNIPVIYQDKVMGYFCIEFTKQVRIFNEDDMKGIRNINAQAAVALYHSELFTQAQESSKSKGDFIANISNELTVPLDNIIGFSETLINHRLEPNKQREYLNVISESSKYLSDLRNDIISISQIESKNFKLNYSNIDIENLITDVINSVRESAENKTINIDPQLERANLYADRERIIQIFYNILITLIRLTPESGNFRIKTEVDSGKLITGIEEVGKNIDVGALNTIFHKFKQIDSNYIRKEKGTGIGLSIAKKLIELHKGSISVYSTEDSGICICVTLPHSELLD